jgi:hypothetical protein
LEVSLESCEFVHERVGEPLILVELGEHLLELSFFECELLIDHTDLVSILIKWIHSWHT